MENEGPEACGMGIAVAVYWEDREKARSGKRNGNNGGVNSGYKREPGEKEKRV
jgi:hypothetical protein